MRFVKRAARWVGHQIDRLGLVLQDLGTRIEYGWAWEGHEIALREERERKGGK